MTPLKHITVALDLTFMDGLMLDYLKFLSQALLPDKMVFLHIIPEAFIPEGVFANAEEKQAYTEKHIASTREELEKSLNAYWGHRPDITPEIEVRYGHPLKELLQFVEANPTDLLVVGKKRRSTGSGIIAQKLARRVKNAILFIPEEATPKLTKMMVPVDFSEPSQEALSTAVNLHPLLENPSIECVHVYEVPPIVSIKIGRTPEQYSQIIKANVQESLEQFIAKAGTGKAIIHQHLLYNNYPSPAQELVKFAKENKIDFILTGAKGHNRLESLFLGSVTEKLITSPLNIPIMIVR